MDFDNDKSVNNNSDMWEWQEGDYLLKENPSSDISRCLWDEMNQSEESLMFMLNEQTPIKDCADFDYEIAKTGDYASKLVEECIDFSQQKRRRMLHFPVDSKENAMTNMQSSSIFLRAKEREDEQIDDEPSPSINVEWTSHWHLGISDGTCALNSEAWDQPSEDGSTTALRIELQKVEQMKLLPRSKTSADEAYKKEVDITESNNFAADMETDLVHDNWPTPLCKILKGRKSMIKTSAKLTTSVAYPFALIKPCGVEGDLTLKDINQRLHTPPPSRSMHIQGNNHSLSYHTSAFSGKPVVVKTKIRTEGGKGSITIMRTKG
ncbi:hypothetical protein HPP92_000354 [Vanilla planifolia]|uniref:Protein XRI1 n=1 Tax=Vanilla planifolia TaxID=51239 RepID=A0A835SB18_VANPL|nr:hypothetical protein HPP92_000354 [Vanilla planifolia]